MLCCILGTFLFLGLSGHRKPSRAGGRDRFSPTSVEAETSQDVAPGVEEEPSTAQRMERQTESRLEEEAAPATWMESETAVIPWLVGERRGAPGIEDGTEPPLGHKTNKTHKKLFVDDITLLKKNIPLEPNRRQTNYWSPTLPWEVQPHSTT